MDHNKKIYTKSIVIYAPVNIVWRAITEPELMQQWMGSTEMQLQITTDWQPGSEFVLSGYLPKAFENRGKVLRYEKESRLAYSHLSSLSDLPEDSKLHRYRIYFIG